MKKLSTKKARIGKKRLKDYGKVLLAKQLLRAVYNNPRERVFKKYFEQSTEKAGSSTGKSALTKLSSRLEVVLTAMGGALSNGHARQLINHGKISVNGHSVTSRGFLLKDGDIVSSAVGLNWQRSEANSKVESSSQELTPLESLRIASIKPKSLPKELNLESPVLANLLVNKELNYGIYCNFAPSLQKHLGGSFGGGEATDRVLASDKLSSKSDLGQRVGLDWKNTKVSAMKTLVLDLKTASESEKVKLCTLLYKLTSAYYSRVS